MRPRLCRAYLRLGYALPMISRPPRKRAQLRRTYLREWREYRQLTQEMASERLEITQGQLSRIERGQVPYSQGLLEAAADAYRCEPWDLLNVNPLVEGDVIDAESKFRQAGPDQKRQIAEFIEFITRQSGS